METEDVFVGLGSNLGDSAQILLNAWSFLGQHEGIEVKKLSPPFLSAPVDMSSNHWFTNAVGHLSTTLSPNDLLGVLLATEETLGRVRNGGQRGYRDRMIDLDLLFFGSTSQDEPRLTLPHPRVSERLFVLAPLAAIVPDFVDPMSGKSVDDLHLALKNKIKNNETANQEISVGVWPDV